MSTKEFKCPPARLARLFRQSRDAWKQRAAAKQRSLKKMRITVRDLTLSRDRWRAVARPQAAQLAALRTQLARARSESPAGGR